MGPAEQCFPFLKELQISNCTNLEAFIVRPPYSSTGVKVPYLFDYKVIIPNLEKLGIQGLKSKKIVYNEFPEDNELIVELFSKLKVLEVKECDELSTVIPHFILPNLQSLESLKVKRCKSLSVIFEFRDGKPTAKRSWKLKSIILSRLPSLVNTCGNESFSDYFPFNELNLLKVVGCESLGSIFTVSTVKIMEKLQELGVQHCKLMNQVIEWRPDRSIEGTNEIIFPQLSILELYDLPELGSFCGKCTTNWPSLTDMEISNCGSVKAFVADLESHCEPLFLLEKVAFPKLEALQIYDMRNMTELWNISREGKDLEHSSEALFPKLKTLKMSDCNQLSTIFPSKMVREVRKLEELAIEDCKSVKQVFQVQGLRSKTKSIDDKSSNPLSFSLTKLELEGLGSLDCVWDIENGEGIDLSFDELQEITVYECSLQYLFPVSMVRYLSKLEVINIRNCENILEIAKKEGSSGGDNFDETDHPQFVSFPKVTTLRLGNLQKLRSFITCSNLSDWPSLKLLEICGCPKAKIPASRLQKMSGGCDNIAPVKKVDLFSNLKSFHTDMEGLQEMQSLDGFVNVADLWIYHAQRFPWKLLERFHSLEMLGIYSSSSEDLFQSENEEAKTLMVEVLGRVKNLQVSSCGSLKNLFPTSASFSNLAMISVSFCREMEYLLTASTAGCLKQLTVLHVRWCDNMEEIVRQDHDEICLPRLKELRLRLLPKLKSFSSSENCSFEFRSLESVFLSNLPQLEAFCKGGFTAPLLHDVDVSRNRSTDEQNRLKALMEFDD